MNAADNYQFETSRKDLAAGILKQVGLDLRRFHGATSAVEREFFLDAHRWVTSDDYSWPFSFLNVCQTLNLAPETVREGCWVACRWALSVIGHDAADAPHANFKSFLATF